MDDLTMSAAIMSAEKDDKRDKGDDKKPKLKKSVICIVIAVVLAAIALIIFLISSLGTSDRKAFEADGADVMQALSSSAVQMRKPTQKELKELNDIYLDMKLEEGAPSIIADSIWVFFRKGEESTGGYVLDSKGSASIFIEGSETKNYKCTNVDDIYPRLYKLFQKLQVSKTDNA